MPSPEPLSARLSTIHDFINGGKTAVALQHLNELISHEPSVEAHHLRLRVLLMELHNTPLPLEGVSLLAESLAWLEDQQRDGALAEFLPHLQAWLQQRLDQLRAELIDGDGHSQLAEIDELLPLADRFPAVHLLRGLAFMEAAQHSENAAVLRSGQPSLMDRVSSRSSFGQPNQNTSTTGIPPRTNPSTPQPERRKAHSYRQQDLAILAEQAFQRALLLLPDADHSRGELYRALGQLHEVVLGDTRAALAWYERGLEFGLPLVEKINYLRRQIVDQTAKRLLRQVDNLIEHQHDRAAELLNVSSALHGLAAVQLRLADLDLLRGQLTNAQKRYRKLLDAQSDQSNEIVSVLDIPLNELALLDDLLPKTEKLSLQANGAGLPCARYAIAPDSLRQRAWSGLILAYRQQGQDDELQTAIRALLQERDLKPESITLLLSDLKRSDARAQQQQYQRLQGIIAHSWREGDWSSVAAACGQLIGLSLADGRDYARLVAAMHQTGKSADALVHVLHQVSSEDFAVLADEIAQPLLDALGAANYWEVADRYISAAAQSDDGKKWRRKYKKRRVQFLSELLASARQALEKGQIERAEIDVRRALQIESDPQATLILARVLIARSRLADARQLLLSLPSDAMIAREAAIALAEIDVAEGYLLQARQRLNSVMGDVDTSHPALVALAMAVEHRITRTPVVAIEQVDSQVSPDSLRRVEVTVWSATFAVRLIGVRALRSVPSIANACAELLTALGQINENLDLRTHFAWRYVSDGGSLRIALLCRVEADSKAAAQSASDAMWHTVKSLLPLQDEQVYAYEPVMSLSELEALRQPFTADSAVEIVRKEAIVRVNENEIYFAYPFAQFEGGLSRMLRALVEQSEPALVDIYIQPTSLLPWERSAIREMLDASQAPIDDEIDFVSIFNPHATDERYDQAVQYYPEYLRHTQTLAFVVRIHVASQGRMNPALPNVIAMSLFGPSRYEMLPAVLESELEIVRRDLREVAAERWSYSAAPSTLGRLRYLLTPGEALTAARLPVPGPDGLPGLPVLKIKATPLPANLPDVGVIIGESVTPVQGRPALIRAGMSDRMRHTYVIGRTGTGKSTLLQNLALQDIEAGHGVGVIDPHGDLVEAILERIPSHRVQDVVLFDPSDTERPIGLNILDVEGTFEQNMVVAEFIGLMYSMFDPNRIGMVGPRFENAVRNAMLTAMSIPGSTLIEVVRILSDGNYMRQCLQHVSDPIVQSYWRDIVGNQSDFHKSEVLDYITSKFGRFITDHLVRNIIGQSENTLDFAQIMNDGKILLVNLAKGKIGPQNSHFLGLLLVPRLLVSALSRARMNAQDRRLFCLYVDEFHNFTTPAFSVMLSEARKYRLALTVANQFISQLDAEIRESVFGNVGTLLAFQVGVKDAHFLAPEMYPVFDVDDMVNLPNFHLLAKMMVNGSAAPQFPVRALPDARLANPTLGETIRGFSRQRYGRDAFIVNHEIQQRFDRPVAERVKSGPTRSAKSLLAALNNDDLDVIFGK